MTGRYPAATPEQVALYDPRTYPGLPGETCRACTGSGHRYSRIEGKSYLIECSVCEGGGVVTAIRIKGVAA